MLRSRSGLPLIGLLLAHACGPAPGHRSLEPVLRVAIASEPQTWNQLLVSELTTYAIADQLHDPLVRVNPETQEVEPALARSWEFSRDGSRLVFHLREGVRFSDGMPLRAEDVAFTFRALYDAAVASPLVETARIDGTEFEVEAVDEMTVAFTLPRRTAGVERVFDSIPILPAHVLEASLARGTFPADSGLGAPASRIVGLGPFRLAEYRAGERVVLERNPHYWRRGEKGDPLPRLERLVFDILPDPNGRLLRLRAGEVDLVDFLTPDAFESLQRERNAHLELLDLGPGLLIERLWFNLNPEASVAERKKSWFADRRFRRAVSAAIDRSGMARVVFSSRATPASGPVSVANFQWKDPALREIPHEPEAARALLAEADFQWNAEGRLVDRGGEPVSFTIVTNSESPHRGRMGAFLQEDLAKIGIQARTATLQGASLMGRLTVSFDYEAGLLGVTQTDPDPTAAMPFWLSRGSLHFWHPRQEQPRRPWEARMDELMERQGGELDPSKRRELYFEVQRILTEERPLIDLVVPHALVARHRRVKNLRPTPLSHVLWNAEELEVGPEAEKKQSDARDPRH